MERALSHSYLARMFRFLDRHITFARGLTLRVLSFAMMAWFITGWAPEFVRLSGGLQPLDARFGYSVADAETLLTALGPDGRHFYLRMASLDVVFVLIAALGDWMLLTLLLRKVGVGLWPRAVVLIGYGADLLENALYGIALIGGPTALLAIASVATVVKQLSGLVLLLSYALGLSYWAWRKVSGGSLEQSSSNPSP